MHLSDFELDVMQVIWRGQESAAPEVHKTIAKDRNVTYSTVKTIIDRLEQKGAIVRCGQTGRTIYFRATVSPDEIQRPLLDQFVSRVFGGDRRPLFNHLLAAESLSDDEVEFLECLLAERRRDRKQQ